MIEMKEVYKIYPNGVKAINGINVSIHPGEFVYVVGPSGAGKSTFIKMMYREEKPTKGKILINSRDLASIKEKEIPYVRREIGVVFQDFKLLPTLTVFENVAFALEVIGEQPHIIKKKCWMYLIWYSSSTKHDNFLTSCLAVNSSVYLSLVQS